jgi:protoporphyrinogen oxidase
MTMRRAAHGAATRIAVIGSGMAGCGAMHRLSVEGLAARWYDKNPYPGGHTASFEHAGGFLFDLGPHISFTKDPRIQELLAANVDQQFETVQIRLNNYWQGHWPEHPVQLHLHGLPDDLVIRVISDFVAERQAGEPVIRNYADWLVSSFGRTFAETFPMTYTQKYHLTTADNMTTDWLGPRIYRPSLEEVLRGALSPAAAHNHYITHFRYPRRGGFAAYLHAFHALGEMELGHEVEAIDPRTREISFTNGSRERADAIISSMPLPELVPRIMGAPAEVVEAAGRLACSSCVLVNIGVDREDLSDAHMTYFYDEDICFTRVNFPHMLSPANVPAGAGSIQAEVYFSRKYRPFSGRPEDLIDPVLADLRRTGILREDDRILFRNAMVVSYANVIFDLDRTAALATVHGYLEEIGVHSCGRYGEWGYLWTDEAFKSGEQAAGRVLATLTSPSRRAS